MKSFMTDTKTKILDAASALFLEGGAQALSVRAIAGRAEISTIGIYSHFKGKQGILDALYTQAAEMASRAMDVPFQSMTPRAALLEAANNYVSLSETHEAHYRLFFGESDPGYTPSEEAQAAGETAFGKLLQLTAYVLPEGSSPQACREAALGTWALMHGFFGLRHHAGADKMQVNDWRALILKTVVGQMECILAEREAKASA